MLEQSYLEDVRRTYRNYRTLADAALEQVSDIQFLAALDADGNSLAVLVQHLAGNLRSRFSGFLAEDGEKADRNRDAEFEGQADTGRATLMAGWNDAWAIVLRELDGLTSDDLERTVYIRSEAFAVVEALNRSLAHTAYHVGQIVFLAKHLAGPRWTSLSIPKGRSAEFATGTFKQGIVQGKSLNR